MWKITAKSNSDAEILLYDEISEYESEDWGLMNAKGLINKVKALGNIQNITLRINCVGGDVFEAQAMYSYLKSHPANITVRVDGLAASAASVVAMAGNKVIMSAGALMMIHNPAGGVWGEAEDMRDTAEILDKIRDTIANVYVAKTGLDREKVISMMNDETWLTANEAHNLKFCDEVEGSVAVTAMAVKGGTIFKSGFGFARIDGFLSEKLPKNAVKIDIPSATEDKSKEVKTEMDIKNVIELEKVYPDFAGEIRNTADEAGYKRGVQAERERLKALDGLNAPGREAIIAKAKYGEPKDARDVAIELLQADRTQAQLNALHQDAETVNGALPPQRDIPSDKADEEAAMNAVANEISRMRGYR
ncbi:MAG: Clp protease ClpP [Synergistaceae bacterium]|nr:Clp protease ClpP [Synergistaceae bacterium]